MDYILNIYKNKKYIGTIGGSHMAYDNVLWWELNDIVSLACDDEEKVIKDIISKSDYWKKIDNLKLSQEIKASIDLELQTINMDYLLDFRNVCDSKELTVKDGKYFVIYDNEDFEVKQLSFEDAELLTKKQFSFCEFKKVFTLIKQCLVKYEDNDFIINSDNYLKLSVI